jgi:hypothetical protein
MKVKITLPMPHSDIQRLIYDFFVVPKGPQELWLACGTKFGKTFSVSAAMSRAFPTGRAEVSRWVAPIYRQTKIGYKYLEKMLPGKPFVTYNKADMEVAIPSRDNTLQLWHGQHPEDLEGEGVKRQANDECAKMKEQVYESSRTTWTRTGARRINLSTPRGRNFFYKGCMRAIKEEKAAAREGRMPTMIFRSARTEDNPYIPKESIEQARKLMPQRLFDQYYLAKFVDGASTFPPLMIDENMTGGRPYQQTSDRQQWVMSDSKDRTVVMGADWAKRGDYTVFIAIDPSIFPFRMVGFLKLPQGTRYRQQIIDLARWMKSFKRVDTVWHDRTGVGDAIDELLDAIPGLNYKGIVFSNSSKATMVNDLIVGIEQKEMLFPWWEDLQQEFEAYEVQATELGILKYNAAEGSHDDIVCSTLLAFSAAKQYAPHDFEVDFVEELPDLEFAKTELEEYLEDQLDYDYDEGF